MRFNVLHKGDEVINVTNEFIAIRRKQGEVELIQIICEDTGIRIDQDNIITIGYGQNEVTYENEQGVSIVNF